MVVDVCRQWVVVQNVCRRWVVQTGHLIVSVTGHVDRMINRRLKIDPVGTCLELKWQWL